MGSFRDSGSNSSSAGKKSARTPSLRGNISLPSEIYVELFRERDERGHLHTDGRQMGGMIQSPVPFPAGESYTGDFRRTLGFLRGAGGALGFRARTKLCLFLH